MFYTYLYIDPSKHSRLCPEGEPIYVGKGKDDRCFSHLKRKDTHHFTRRLNKMKRAGVEPIIKMLAQDIDEELAFLVEEEAISKFGRRDLGLGPLLNKTDGGEGFAGYVWTEQALKNLGEGVKKALQDKELIARRTAAVTEARNRPDVKEKVKQALIAAHSQPEVFARYSKGIKEALAKPESKERQRAAAKARATPELNAKRSQTLKQTLEQRSEAERIRHGTAIRQAKLRPCTVDGITIYPSVRDLVKALGQGIQGRKNPNFRYVKDNA